MLRVNHESIDVRPSVDVDGTPTRAVIRALEQAVVVGGGVDDLRVQGVDHDKFFVAVWLHIAPGGATVRASEDAKSGARVHDPGVSRVDRDPVRARRAVLAAR